MNNQRKQISVALTARELATLDLLRGHIPRGIFLRTLLLEKEEKQMGLKQRVNRLKAWCYDHWQEEPDAIAFSPRERMRIEEMKREDLGNSLLGKLMTKGVVHAFPSFLGLEVKSWDASELTLYSGSKDITESYLPPLQVVRGRVTLETVSQLAKAMRYAGQARMIDSILLLRKWIQEPSIDDDAKAFAIELLVKYGG
jgi:hypothetical protein